MPAATAVTPAMHASFAAIRRSVGANLAGIGVRIAKIHAFARLIDGILAGSSAMVARVVVIARTFAPNLAGIARDIAVIVATVVVARGAAGLDAPDVPILNVSFGRNAADIATETANLAMKTADVAMKTADVATETANLAMKTADVAMKTADVATETANLAMKTADINDVSGCARDSRCGNRDSRERCYPHRCVGGRRTEKSSPAAFRFCLRRAAIR